MVFTRSHNFSSLSFFLRFFSRSLAARNKSSSANNSSTIIFSFDGHYKIFVGCIHTIDCGDVRRAVVGVIEFLKLNLTHFALRICVHNNMECLIEEEICALTIYRQTHRIYKQKYRERRLINFAPLSILCARVLEVSFSGGGKFST